MTPGDSSSSKTVIILALITAAAGWGTSAITNWDKLFGQSASNSNTAATKASAPSAATRTVAVRAVANALSHDSEVGGKLSRLPEFPGLTEDEVRYRGLRRAVFVQIYSFQADKELLMDALNTMKRQGAKILDSDIRRIEAELPELLRTKLQWLKKDAIPELTAYMKSPAAQAQQRTSTVQVRLPESVWIIPQSNASADVSQLSALQEEARLLESIL